MQDRNRRACDRAPLVAACCLRCRPGGAVYSGRIESISRSAALIAVTAIPAGCGAPRVGERLIVDVQLPPISRFGRKCLRCFGQVVRVVDDGLVPELAVSLAHMAFQDAGEQGEAEAWRRMWCDA